MVYRKYSQYAVIPHLLPPPFPPSPLSIKAEMESKRRQNGSSPPMTASSVAQRLSGCKEAVIHGKLHFHDLPPEIIGMVFKNIPNLLDAFCLGITCTFAWSCGEHQIEELWTIIKAPCIGHIIVCLGDWLKTLPPACRMEDVRDEIALAYGHPSFEKYQTMSDEERNDVHWDDGSPWRAPSEDSDSEEDNDILSLFMESLAFGLSGRTSSSSRWPSDNNLHRFWGARSIAEHFDWALARLWIEGPHSRSTFEHENILVLRNLSRRIFVRSDILTSDMADGARLLGQGLLYYISWSDCVPSGFEGRDPIISEGPWAGNRFDIVTLESLGGDCARLTQDGWEDGSQEVRARIEIVEGWDVLEEGRAPYTYYDKPNQESQSD
ncbi:hypothetical protein DL93DRAFT_2162836 [Clavulina sp. PMI_390]|nr:hypothetical protein DL93DRAFT_2162836 [Clavulina sp. PMI_390]